MTTLYEGSSATEGLPPGHVLTVTADQAASSHCSVKRSSDQVALDETEITTAETFGPYLAPMTMVIACDTGNLTFEVTVATDSTAVDVASQVAAFPGADEGAVLTLLSGVPTWVVPA